MKYFLFFIFFTSSIIAQETKKEDTVSTQKYIYSMFNGIEIPKIALTNINDPKPAMTSGQSQLQICTVIYNTTKSESPSDKLQPGYFYWNGNSWINFDNTIKSNEVLPGNSSNFLTPTK